jgi:hypothetical protein
MSRDSCRRETGRRLVEEKEARTAAESEADLELTLLAVGQVSHPGVGDPGEPHRVQGGPGAGWRSPKAVAGRSMAKRLDV